MSSEENERGSRSRLLMIIHGKLLENHYIKLAAELEQMAGEKSSSLKEIATNNKKNV